MYFYYINICDIIQTIVKIHLFLGILIQRKSGGQITWE